VADNTDRNKYRGRSFDPKSLDDGKPSEASKAYFEMAARKEAEGIAKKFGQTPGFLRLVAHHLSLLAKGQGYPTQQHDYDRMKREITAGVLKDIGWNDDNA
jgi:hypothetical protein